MSKCPHVLKPRRLILEFFLFSKGFILYYQIWTYIFVAALYCTAISCYYTLITSHNFHNVIPLSSFLKKLFCIFLRLCSVFHQIVTSPIRCSLFVFVAGKPYENSLKSIFVVCRGCTLSLISPSLWWEFLSPVL